MKAWLSLLVFQLLVIPAVIFGFRFFPRPMAVLLASSLFFIVGISVLYQSWQGSAKEGRILTFLKAIALTHLSLAVVIVSGYLFKLFALDVPAWMAAAIWHQFSGVNYLLLIVMTAIQAWRQK